MMISLTTLLVARLYLPFGKVREGLIGLAIVLGAVSSIGVFSEYVSDHLAVFFSGGLVFAKDAYGRNGP